MLSYQSISKTTSTVKIKTWIWISSKEEDEEKVDYLVSELV